MALPHCSVGSTVSVSYKCLHQYFEKIYIMNNFPESPYSRMIVISLLKDGLKLFNSNKCQCPSLVHSIFPGHAAEYLKNTTPISLVALLKGWNYPSPYSLSTLKFVYFLQTNCIDG